MRYWSSASLVLVLAIGTTASADDKPLLSPYYPLAVGNTWNYKVGEVKFTMKVAKYEEINKQLCARVEMSVNDKVQAVEHVFVKDDGVYRAAFENKQADPPVKFLKLPPKAGETWEVKSKIGAESLSGTFRSGEVAELMVGGTKYTGVYTSESDNLDANGTKIAFKYYFAKDIGMIKQTIKIAGQEVNIELEKFEAAKP
jgi:hypothetical protein